MSRVDEMCSSVFQSRDAVYMQSMCCVAFALHCLTIVLEQAVEAQSGAKTSSIYRNDPSIHRLGQQASEEDRHGRAGQGMVRRCAAQ